MIGNWNKYQIYQHILTNEFFDHCFSLQPEPYIINKKILK
jgi:hypothetical protein